MTLYSHSRLNTYQNCPLQYKFKYVEREPIESRNSIEAFLGSRVHETLEYLYKMLINRRILSKDEMLAYYRNLWEKEWHDGIYIVRGDLHVENYFEQGIFALEHYYDRYHPFDQDRTIALELRVELSLDDAGEYRMQGYIDRLSETDDGHYQIRDYKTERTFKEQSHFDRERQLALYQIGVSSMFRDIKSVELIWHYLLFDKEGRSRRSREDLERLKIETIYLIQEIEKATEKDEFPYRESALCDWCDYYPLCPAKKHMHMTSAMTPVEFNADLGVQAVDRLLEIRDELKSLETEKRQIQAALLDYSREVSADVIRGSAHKAKVSYQPAYRAKCQLSKDESEEREFMQWLRSHELLEDAIALHHSKINSLVRRDDLSPEIRNQLMDFVVLVDGSPRFFLSKLKKNEIED